MSWITHNRHEGGGKASLLIISPIARPIARALLISWVARVADLYRCMAGPWASGWAVLVRSAQQLRLPSKQKSPPCCQQHSPPRKQNPLPQARSRRSRLAAASHNTHPRTSQAGPVAEVATAKAARSARTTTKPHPTHPLHRAGPIQTLKSRYGQGFKLDMRLGADQMHEEKEVVYY